MAQTVSDTSQLGDALAVYDSDKELPQYVAPEERALAKVAFLDQETIDAIRLAGTESSAYTLYLAWRRRQAVRLSAQGWTHKEIAAQLGVSHSTITHDIRKVRELYTGVAHRDWALLVEERLMGIDSDIHTLRTRYESIVDKDISTALSIFDRIVSLEAKRDKLLGLDKAAASQYSEKKLVVNLSFDNPSHVQPEQQYIEATYEDG